MKIIGVCGSPRKGNSEFMLRTILKTAESKNVKTELILLKEKNIVLCDGCLICSGGKACKIQDDMTEIYPKIKVADVIVFSSPVYYDMISPQMLNFIVRLRPLKNELKGKKFAFTLAGQLTEEDARESIGRAADYLKQIAKIRKLNLVGFVLAKGVKEKNDVKNKEDVIKQCRELGEKLFN